jgi:GxxExxY protein
MINDKLTENVIASAIKVHKYFGPGLLETIYEEALCYELNKLGIQYEQQSDVDVYYDNQVIKKIRVDLIIDGTLLIELKSTKHDPKYTVPQMLTYLRATKLKKGLIINFGFSRLVDGIKRVIN